MSGLSASAWPRLITCASGSKEIARVGVEHRRGATLKGRIDGEDQHPSFFVIPGASAAVRRLIPPFVPIVRKDRGVMSRAPAWARPVPACAPVG